MKAILYDWGGLNIWLFQMINAIHNNVLDHYMVLGSKLAEHNSFALYLGLITLGALISLHGKGKKPLQVWFTVIAVFSLGYLLDGWLVESLKSWLSFPRPSLALPLDRVLLVGKPELNLQQSLPSGHASFAMLISASLWPVLNRYGRYIAIVFVMWVGISRISLGAHFPADVVAGALSCLILVLSLRKLIKLILR